MPVSRRWTTHMAFTPRRTSISSKCKTWRFYANGEIVAELSLAVKPSVGKSPRSDHGGRRESHVLGIMGHDRVQVAIVPGVAPSGGFLPGFLQGNHRSPYLRASRGFTMRRGARLVRLR